MLSTTAKIFKISFYVLLLVIGITLCVVNRGKVEITLFPLPYAISLPLFLFTIGIFIIGILTGWGISRFKILKISRKQKETQGRLLALENELAATRTEKLLRGTAAK
jgi:uncharacterized integral membrane protein